MKAKNGKCGVFAALTAALLVTAALITSCPEPEERIVYRDGYQYPAGYGSITINAPEFNGKRTVLPTEPNAWVEYDLVIQKYTSTESSGTTTGDPIEITGVTDLTTPIYLAQGAYTVKVTAYTDEGKAAIGTSDRYPVMPGQATHITVVIKPLPFAATGDGSEDGTFEYTITILKDIIFDTLDITIQPQGSGTGVQTINLITPTSPVVGTPVTLKPDSYLVFLAATIGSNTATFVEVVNIHQYLTSSATFTFDDNQFLASIAPIDVDYRDPDIKPVLSTTGPITLALDLAHDPSVPGTETITITNATAAGYTSMEWYSGSLTPIGTGASLTITAGTTPFTLQRAYPVTVVGVVETDGISRSYSETFTVVIGN